MTHAQDRLRRKIQHQELSIKKMERQVPQLKEVIADPNSNKSRKIQGQALLDKVNRAIETTKKEIKLMEMQI